ncbi:MAG: hypothetical protein RLZZ440_806 [Planctomycetota bacterium]|jgi:hypothetical protein
MHHHTSALVLALGLWAFLGGCGQKTRQEKTYPVAGTVRVDEEPLKDGEIYFRVIETGSLMIVPVKEGRFAGRAPGGRNRVEINAFREVITPEGKAMYGELATPSRHNTIPAKYNLESNLHADVQPDGGNKFAFEVSLQ